MLENKITPGALEEKQISENEPKDSSQNLYL